MCRTPAEPHAIADRIPYSHRPTSRFGRLVTSIALALATVLLVVAMFVSPELELRHVVKEDYPVLEYAQVIVWALVPLVAVFGAWRQRSNRGLLLLVWIGVLCFLFGMRELDLQVLVNTDNIHVLGFEEEHAFHWRSRWLLEAETPLMVRILWIGVFGLIGAALVLPWACARYPWPTAILKRDPFPWLLGLGFGLLGASVLIDDVIGRPLRERGWELDLLEELVETAGGACVVLWTLWLASGKANLRTPKAAPVS